MDPDAIDDLDDLDIVTETATSGDHTEAELEAFCERLDSAMAGEIPVDDS